MKTVAIFLSLSFMAILLQSCGEVEAEDIKKAALERSKYLVKITVDVSDARDPIIYIYAQEADYDKSTGTIVIKDGFLTTTDAQVFTAAIYIQEATFQSRFPTSISIKELATRQKVEIKNK